VREAPAIDDVLDRLSRLDPNAHEAIRTLSGDIRRILEATAIPQDVAAEIDRALAALGSSKAFAVRSSATAEDLPSASFAGQHDTYLSIVGRDAILDHVRRCWASLFSERAVTYRLRNRLDNRRVRMAVVVQEMIFPQAAGVLFTADPVTGHRTVAAVEAVAGLADALVSGLTNADIYKVKDGNVVSSTKRQGRPTLADAQVVRLVALGRRIESHFGRPQDIEWCLLDDDFHFVQSRPITTLFPIPKAADRERHVYISSGHQQMMTDAMTPLGISVRQLTGATTFHEAGGRLFVDVTRALASPSTRAPLMQLIGRSDPLIGDALQSLVERGFVQPSPDAKAGSPPPGTAPANIETDPRIVAELVETSEASIARLKEEIRTKSGPALLDFIAADIQEMKRILFDRRSHQAIMAGMEAAWWLNDQLEAWLGEKNAADVLTRSVAGNVTSEMGLALLDVADAIRPHADVVAFLRQVEDDGFLDELPAIEGGTEVRDAIVAWLDKYGMRCAGEIDITCPRWSERPSTIVPMILGNIRNVAPGEARRRFERGLQDARSKEREVLERLRDLPDGAQKAEEVKRTIDRVRTFAGYREYPKYAIVSRHFVYKQSLLKEADRLVHAGELREKEDMFFLTFDELRDVLHTRRVDQQLVLQRKDAFEYYRSLTPPRVLTSEGEAVTGAYRRDDLPRGALAGVAVSAGVVEGRARVVLDIGSAALEPGDILVTVSTDPSWTPLFVAITGMVTEVGGPMTHGAVIAREYGLPAVVGVENATRLIRDGQRIRVHGTDGYVEILG
jgi:pyruvate,water dikinase